MLRLTLVRFAFVVLLLAASARAAEFDPQPALERTILGPDQTLTEAQQFCRRKLLPIPSFDTAEAWQKYADGVRKRVLDEVVLRGEAAAWAKAKTKVEWTGELKGGEGYRIRKLRYEALPGMWIPALLYEPTKLEGKLPVFLNVNGHGAEGKAADFKQARCINQAKRGILALNVEWFNMGQLRTEGFAHDRINQIDLCGTSGIATHYLAMHRGIDLLLDHPNADPTRVGVAGLSGGGWQTIFISSLDTRVTLTNPVAGYSSFVTRTQFASDLGDSEQTPVDLGMVADYALLTAMLAPRAALLTFNAKDNCCFAADHALPPLVDAAWPVYGLFGKQMNLRSQVNYVPGTHNFGLENREALYRMIGDTFFPGDEKYPRHEIDCAAEIKNATELAVELPKQSEDFHTLAVKLAQDLPRQADMPTEPTMRKEWLADARRRLIDVTRYREERATLEVDHTSTSEGIAVRHCRFKVGDDWTVPAVEFTPEKASGTAIAFAEAGRKSLTGEVRKQLSAGRRVLAVDPFFWGESTITKRGYLWSLMISTVGSRPTGVQAGELTAIARWAKAEYGQPVELIAGGPRAGVVALVAAALEQDTIASVRTDDPLPSLKRLLEQNITLGTEPDSFCFGLLAEFDTPQLQALVGEAGLVTKK